VSDPPSTNAKIFDNAINIVHAEDDSLLPRDSVPSSVCSS